MSSFRVCVVLRKARRWRFPKNGMRFSLSSPRYNDASSVVGGRVEMCPWRISRDTVGVGIWWVCFDPTFARLHSCVNSTLFRRYNAVIAYLEGRHYVLAKSDATALIT